jgi:hypothetical protein
VNAHIKTWTVQSNENFIPHSGGTGNDDYYIMTPEEHRRIKKEMSVSSRKIGDGATAADLDINQHDDVKDNSRTEGVGNDKSGVSENSATSAGNTEARFRNPHSVAEYDNSGNIHEYSSTTIAADFKHRNSDAYELKTNLMTEPAMSSNLAEETRDPESHFGLSGTRFVKSRRDEENNTLGSRGEHYGSNSFSNEELSSMNDSGKPESLSEVGKRQIIQHNFRENMTVRNHVLNKNEDTTVAEPPRPHIDDDDRFHTVDNTEADLGFSRSRLDQNNSQGNDGDGSTKYAFSDFLLHQEDGPQTSFDNGVEQRHVIGDQAPSYYAHSPPAAAHVNSGWNEMSQLCVVPCSPMNYHIHPYAYGSYGSSGLGQSYATVGQVPHAQLPPVQFPEIHGTSSVAHGIQVGSAGAYGGPHSYGGVSLPYVQEPTNHHLEYSLPMNHRLEYSLPTNHHLEYSLDTPLRYVHTSLLMKAPQPPLAVPAPYTHPYIHHAEQNIDLHKSTYF